MRSDTGVIDTSKQLRCSAFECVAVRGVGNGDAHDAVFEDGAGFRMPVSRRMGVTVRILGAQSILRRCAASAGPNLTPPTTALVIDAFLNPVESHRVRVSARRGRAASGIGSPSRMQVTGFRQRLGCPVISSVR